MRKKLTSTLDQKELHHRVKKLIVQDEFYTHPKSQDIELVKLHIMTLRAQLLEKSNKVKYASIIPLLNLAIIILELIAQKKLHELTKLMADTQNLISIKDIGINESLKTMSVQNFSKLLLSTIIENTETYNRGFTKADLQFFHDKDEVVLKDCLWHPVTYIQQAFSQKYNEHVKWVVLEKSIDTQQLFTKKEQALACIKKLNDFGIYDATIVPVEKAFRVSINAASLKQVISRSLETQAQKMTP